MNLFTDYWNEETRELVLPPGEYSDIDPVKRDDLTIRAKDPTNPPRIHQLIIFGQSVRLHNLYFPYPQEDTRQLQGALVLRGHYAAVEYCRFDNNVIGIQAEKPAYIANNTITCFRQDGIQFSSSGMFIEGNVIGGLVLEEGKDPAHHDCIQGWAGDPESPFASQGRYDGEHALKGVTIHNNLLFDSPGSPLQGITFFDGLAEEWQVTSNHIQLYGPHPLTIRGLRMDEQTKIEHNTFNSGKPEILPARRLVQGQWDYFAV